MAAEYDVEVVLEKLDDVESYVIDRTIVIDPDVYPPRRNWLFCHELAHILLGHTKNDKIVPEMEGEADELACELMLPKSNFRDAMKELDIPGLMEKYPHASWEVVTRRWADERPAVLTIYDNYKLTRRYAPERLAHPLRPTIEEGEAIMDCYQARAHLTRKTEGEAPLMLHMFYVDKGSGVERVLLLTELLEEIY